MRLSRSMPSGERQMTIIYKQTDNENILLLAKRYQVPFESIVKVEIENDHIYIYHFETHNDKVVSCTKVIHDSQLFHHLSHA
jgi:hypothetical protein